ncbi:uncharacterized protein A1O5_06268 [Cladophialophora psammophila CBS 110553]|uniref:Major facilitator superfamily (MFS) profile domain-containing protein n=1 Tax=Cladophialophora psammophila CBS 110553 TaxID=1182543 RepID=W9WYP4_9EURO|nr:uncharacterized protein A1O5_06268 [Cladophialophora psammophila CBS 110553]EXJ70200.1 hypothetical protein A1O5_06268 [Cladophialophora psammophila CBS 110553]
MDDAAEKPFSPAGVELIEAIGAQEAVSYTQEEEKQIVWKIDSRLMPTTALIYLLCYLDRSNIAGNAKILNTNMDDAMSQTNHVTNYQFTVALMVFIVAYCIFQALSNLACTDRKSHPTPTSCLRKYEAKINWKDAKATLKDVILWVHYSTYLAAGSGATSLSLFSPVIVAGLGYHDLRAQLFTVPPYAIAYLVTLAVALWSDNRRVRGLFACAGFSLAAISFLVLAAIPGTHYGVRYFFLILASSGPGQIIGVWIYRAQDASLYKLGHGVNAASQLIGASVALGLYFHYKKLNRRLIGTNATRWIP